MEKTIDCLLIGHNEMNFTDYEYSIRRMGVNSGAYRDLNLNFIQYNNERYTLPQIFNHFYCGNTSTGSSGSSHTPFTLGETFSAGIAYLGSYLQRRAFTFDYVNSFQEEKEQLRVKLQQENILTIAVLTTLYVSPFPILEIIDFIKQYNRSAKIIVGGPYVTNLTRSAGYREQGALEYALESMGADFYVNSSQGEAALVNIIKALKTNSPVHQIRNIFYKTGDMSYTPTAVSREDNRLAENTVKWDLFANRLRSFVNLRTAISCPFSCAFCGFPQRAGKYQVIEVDDVETELNLLKEIPAVKHLAFIDDTFNVPLERFKEILRMMIRNNYDFKWHSHFRCQFADPETIELMKESGCEGVFLGIESGSNEILGNMNKKTTVEKYLKGLQLLKDNGILTYGSFIIGFPGETEETVQETIKFITQGGLDFFRVQLWYCEPITPIFKRQEEFQIEGESFEWSHKTMDSKRAADIVEDIFLSFEDPVWIPQYNFEFDGLFHLLHKGIPLEQVTRFLKAFNSGIKEKLNDPSRREVSAAVLRQLEETCMGDGPAKPPPGKGKNILSGYNADFEL